jgi:tetratricopeptide (TPR) repeat protein
VRAFAAIRTLGVLAGLALATPAGALELKDPFFGEALYYAHQGDYFDALERLDAEIAQHYGVDEPHLDSLQHHIDHAEFSVGDFELNYRMHHRAGRAIKAVLEADVEEPVRNEAAYRLARIHFQKDQPRAALEALDGIRGRMPEGLSDDVEFLRANILMTTHRPDQAVEVLDRLQPDEDLEGFATYNLGIALLRNGETKQAVRELDRAGRIKAASREAMAIRDKSNFVLGTLAFEAEQYGLAQRSLNRVRLEGPFSNQALLGAGWADASAENFERALVPWNILVERNPTDSAVQEGMLALPYAYSKLGIHGRAAMLYERAVETFGAELRNVKASIASIDKGAFLKALVREEIRQDKDWVIRLRSLPDAPETFYLMSLLASHDFQTSLQNYLDLEDMRKKLVAWRVSLDAFEDIIDQRRRYYEPLLPSVDRRFRELDAQIRLRLEQRKHIDKRLQQMLVGARPEHLASSQEIALEEQLDGLQAALDATSGPGRDEVQRRIDRLRGALRWKLEMQYHERLTAAHRHLRELNADVDVLTARYDAFVRTRQAAMHSYAGYQDNIDSLRARVSSGLDRLELLMVRQGDTLEKVAIRELEIRRDRLATYQNKARFAFADSYDRAVKAQSAPAKIGGGE